MKKKILVGLMVMLFSVDVYAKGKSHGGGSFGTNNDIVEKFPTKKIRNSRNLIPGLHNGESLYINAKVVVRTRNYFWLPVWKDGYAEVKITKDNGRAFNVQRLTVMQVQKIPYIYNQMARNEGIGYTSDIKFTYAIDSSHVYLNLTISNGRANNNIGYVQNAYQIPNYFTSVRRIYKNNANSLRLSMKDPSAPVTAFFNVKLTDKLGEVFSLTNVWADGKSVNIPPVTVGTF